MNNFDGFGAPPSLDLPPVLQQMLSTPTQSSAPGVPSYAVGGLITPAGPTPPMPQQSTSSGQVGMTPPGSGHTDPKMMEMQINQFASQHPQELAKVRQVIMQELQSGNLTPQELNQIIQLATVASQNPAMYPNVRTFAIQQGIATEQDLPPQYDEGLVFVLLVAARAAKQELTKGGGAGETIPSMSKGGDVNTVAKVEPGKGKSVIIEAHENEFMIPKVAMDWFGRKHFENLIQKAKEESAMGTGLNRQTEKQQA